MSRNIFSDEAFEAWLVNQPADNRYDYTEPEDCLVTRYFKASGVACKATCFGYQLKRPGQVIAPEEWDAIAIGHVTHIHASKEEEDAWERENWNYGAALKRLRAHMKAKEAA